MAAGAGKAGNIIIRNPWPGIMQTIWGDRDRFVNQYYKKYCKDAKSKRWQDWPYFAADGAVLAPDGYFRILGRVVNDVINVAGHRLGTKEIESACLTVSEVAEAAVVPVVDEIKGRVPEVLMSQLKPGIEASQEIVDKVNKAIETIIGKIARPKNVHIVPDMPKTRSGKLMRRILASISNRMATGDINDARQSRYSGESPRAGARQESRLRVLADGPEDFEAVRERGVRVRKTLYRRDAKSAERSWAQWSWAERSWAYSFNFLKPDCSSCAVASRQLRITLMRCLGLALLQLFEKNLHRGACLLAEEMDERIVGGRDCGRLFIHAGFESIRLDVHLERFDAAAQGLYDTARFALLFGR